VALPREAQTRASERIFKRKVESDTLDTCVNVMVDMSGSMSGEATGHTYIATTLLSNALYVLGVPCEINAFSTGANPLSSTGRSTVIYRLKDWSERVTSEEMFDRYLSVIGCGMANNNDSAALMYAYDRLTQRPETRKILVMQSDGQPACRDVDSDNSKQCLIDAAKAVERSGQVDLLALGVGSEGICSVQGFYSRWAGVHGSAELEEKLFDLVAKRMVNAS
jgi:cobalamin biosynthesis protein CobT